MPVYRLHYFPESGNSYKLALMLTLCGETFDSVASMDAHFSPRGRCRDPWTAQSHGRYLFRVRLSRPNPVVWSLDHPTEAAS